MVPSVAPMFWAAPPAPKRIQDHVQSCYLRPWSSITHDVLHTCGAPIILTLSFASMSAPRSSSTVAAARLLELVA